MLNKDQLKAVRHHQGPLLIIAGAGTGKTTVLVEKIKFLVQTKKAKPDEILALTFTEKAAQEMEERVDVALPYGYFQTWISTFHSFADQILREKINHIGLSPQYHLMNQAENIIFLRQHLYSLPLKYFRPLGSPNKFLVDLVQHFSRLRDEDISPDDYLQWAKKTPAEEQEKAVELAQTYQTYEQLKIKENYFDFSDLISYLLRLFRERPSILREYQQQFKFVLIDEFQDTNIAQYQLIKLLCPPSSQSNLTVVGDDSQAIYKFRGASVSNIITFMKDYPHAKKVTLRFNYRSNQTILDAAYRLIKNNDPDTLEYQLGISKELKAVTDDHNLNAVNLILTEKAEDEAKAVTQIILNLKKKSGYRFSDFALLVRANNHANIFLQTFNYYGIPHRFLGPSQLFKKPEVKDLIAYLKILTDPDDSVSFYRVLSMDIFALSGADIMLMMAFAKKTSLSLYQAIAVYLSFFVNDWFLTEQTNYKKFLPLIAEESQAKLTGFLKMFRNHLSNVHKYSAGQLLFQFLDESGWLKELVSAKTAPQERTLLNVAKFFDRLKSWETIHEDISVMAVVDFLDMSLEMGDSPLTDKDDAADYDAVSVSTVHSAKGLEFPVTFLVNLTNGRFPSYAKKEPIPIPPELIKEILPQGDYHLEEERRLFYVALTRAKKLTYLTASLFYAEGKRRQKISTFVSEALGEDLVKKQSLLKKEEKTQLSIFDYKKPSQSIEKKFHPSTTFSYSQINSYQLCPLQYKYHYVLKIPTLANAAATFGESIHKTLQRFYKDFQENKKIGLEEMLAIYQLSWIPIGYSSSSQQQKMKKEGEKMLTLYLSTFHSSRIKILDLEKLFKLKIDPKIYLIGKIDRVDQLTDDVIEIVDYKTGKKPSAKELENDLQLAIYALAAGDPGLYQKPVEKITLTYYYLQTMERVTQTKTAAELIHVKEKVINMVKEVNQEHYSPRVGPWCKACPFRIICEAWQ